MWYNTDKGSHEKLRIRGLFLRSEKSEKGEKMRMISVIVPCFNEREVLPAMYAELERVRKEDFCGVAEFEYIFIDDGSSDGTVGFIKELRRSDKRVRFISF